MDLVCWGLYWWKPTLEGVQTILFGEAQQEVISVVISHPEGAFFSMTYCSRVDATGEEDYDMTPKA